MSINFPNNPTTDQIYSAGDRTWTWTGVYWKATSSSVGYTGSLGQSTYTSSTTQPLTPQIGDRWFNTDDAVELVWTSDGDSNQWVEISASGFTGKIGYTGSAGGIGYTGSASIEVGYTGSAGSGYVGSRGNVGFTGSQGELGYAGSAGGTLGRGFTGSQGASGFIWESIKTGNFNAIPGYSYTINTTNTAITVTFPSSATLGDTIQLIDYAGTWSINAVTINPSGLRINGNLAQAALNQIRESISFVYIDDTQGWLASSGFAAPNVTQTLTTSYLLVAGGGGGGGTGTGGSGSTGGGGGGGILSGNITLTPGQVYNFTIGGGGGGGYGGFVGNNPGGSGGSTTAFGLTAIGGGGGGGMGAGAAGGSGGGGGYGAGGSGTVGQGNNGIGQGPGGGGGGAGGAGSVWNGGIGLTNSILGAICQFYGSINGTTLTVTSVNYGTLARGQVITGQSILSNTTILGPISASGGVGTYTINNSQSVSTVLITSISVYYSGGGAGCGYGGNLTGSGGLGGGGATGSPGTNGGSNLGGGGGGGIYDFSIGGSGRNGGAGILVLAIPTIYYSGIKSGSPTVNTTSSPGYTLLTYTQSGSYTA